MNLLHLITIHSILFAGLFLYGRSLFKIYSIVAGKKHLYIFDIKITYFYPLVGIAFLSNILFVINFFTPLDNYWIVYTVLLIPLLINYERDIDFNITLKTLTPLLFSPFLISFYNNNPSGDAFMYHFQNQIYIYEEKIVFGLSNLFPNLGFVSIVEYLSVLLWNERNYGLVSFVNILFLTGFYYFIIGLWDTQDKRLKNLSIIVLFISLLDNIGLGGGRNGYFFIQEIGKFDASFGIIFFICFILILIISQKSEIDNLDVYAAFLFVLFSGQIKSTGYILFLPLLIIILARRNFDIFKLIYKNYLLLSISFLWIVRSLINSACLIFPLDKTCISNLKWYFSGQAKLLSQGIISNNRNPAFPYEAYDNYDWIDSYWFPENKSYLINFLITLIVIYILTFSKTRIKINTGYTILLLAAIFNITVWFLFFPNYRFSVGFILSLYIVLLYKNLESENLILKKIHENKIIFFIILLTSAVLVVRLDSYKIAFVNPSEDIVERYELPIQDYVEKEDSFGVMPVNGKCIINIDCSTSTYKIRLTDFNGYKMFIPVDSDYNLEYLKKLQEDK